MHPPPPISKPMNTTLTRLRIISALLAAGHLGGAALAVWGAWKLAEFEVLNSLLFLIALIFIREALHQCRQILNLSDP